MRTIEQTRARAGTWLDRNLTGRLTADQNEGLTVGLDAPSGPTLQQQWPAVREWALQWRELEPTLPDGATLAWETRMVASSRQPLPARLTLTTLDATAAWAGAGHPARVRVARDRWAQVRAAFPETAAEPILRAILPWGQVDVDLLLSTAAWFAAHPTLDHTWTPRQVPVPGLHAKWLDVTGRRTLIARLLGLDQIVLRDRPTQAQVTYVDPDHASASGRRWDILTAGDRVDWPYPPRVVLIVENRDTACYFPPVVPGGVVVLGNGDAAVTAITAVTAHLGDVNIVYWGDIDAEGLRIVSRLRERGHEVTTMLMDVVTYMTYAVFGTNLHPSGRTIMAGEPVPAPALTAAEAALYRQLTDPAFTGHRRIEQERIPLQVAVDTLLAIAGSTAPSTPS